MVIAETGSALEEGPDAASGPVSEEEPDTVSDATPDEKLEASPDATLDVLDEEPAAPVPADCAGAQPNANVPASIPRPAIDALMNSRLSTPFSRLMPFSRLASRRISHPSPSSVRFYLRLSLKNVSNLSKGMASKLSYRSTWLAPGMIMSSLLSPRKSSNAPSLK